MSMGLFVQLVAYRWGSHGTTRRRVGKTNRGTLQSPFTVLATDNITIS